MKKMQWFNEPEKWEIINESTFSIYATPGTDFWRKTHYGFTVDDGPFLYSSLGGEFETRVKITGKYRNRFDQMGLMIRKDERNWIKTGVEYVDGRINLSTVVTRDFSDWSMFTLDQDPESVWLKLIRRIDAIEIQYSLDNSSFISMRLAYFPDKVPVMAGMFAASPDGDGFEALFEDFTIKHLPDLRRDIWLKKDLDHGE